MAKKTIVEQIKDTQAKLEKARTEKKQMENQLTKIKKLEREKEHKSRTRRLIQRGAIIESINPSFTSLSEELLSQYLNQVLRTRYAEMLLSSMLESDKTNKKENDNADTQ